MTWRNAFGSSSRIDGNSYNIRYDWLVGGVEQSNTIFVPAGSDTSVNGQAITGLTPGFTYSITVTAQNVCGFSQASSPLILTAGTVPAPPSRCWTQRTSTGGYRTSTQWIQGADNGFPISGCSIELMDRSGQFRNVASQCEERTTSLTGSDRLDTNVCTLDYYEIEQSPFNIRENDPITSRVVCYN